ncbi:hypothetical protein E2C01_022072 [Portunus trituberculatus]|uniref:Uncharacterized protein n=1 Tax=Portunus trituberculatus TaxID=210409 RepID=A0A5B7E617_PORTR|nr:hypothetical protein [Portunus trituberculatus]
MLRLVTTFITNTTTIAITTGLSSPSTFTSYLGNSSLYLYVTHSICLASFNHDKTSIL